MNLEHLLYPQSKQSPSSYTCDLSSFELHVRHRLGDTGAALTSCLLG